MHFDRKTLFAGLKTALKPKGFNDLQVTSKLYVKTSVVGTLTGWQLVTSV